MYHVIQYFDSVNSKFCKIDVLQIPGAEALGHFSLLLDEDLAAQHEQHRQNRNKNKQLWTIRIPDILTTYIVIIWNYFIKFLEKFKKKMLSLKKTPLYEYKRNATSYLRPI